MLVEGGEEGTAMADRPSKTAAAPAVFVKFTKVAAPLPSTLPCLAVTDRQSKSHIFYPVLASHGVIV